MPPTLQEFDLLTLAEVAKLLQCSKAHVGKAVAGRVRGCPPIPAVSLGRRKLVRQATHLGGQHDIRPGGVGENRAGWTPGRIALTRIDTTPRPIL